MSRHWIIYKNLCVAVFQNRRDANSDRGPSSMTITFTLWAAKLAPDDSILVMRNAGTQEIDALDWQHLICGLRTTLTDDQIPNNQE